MNSRRPLFEGRNSESSLTRIRLGVFRGHHAWLIGSLSLSRAQDDSTALNARPADAGSAGQGAVTVFLGRVGFYPVSLRTNAGLGATLGSSTYYSEHWDLRGFPFILKPKASSLIRTCGVTNYSPQS